MKGMSIQKVLWQAKEKWSDHPYLWRETDPMQYESKTFAETADDVLALSAALLDMGMRGKNIVVYGENCYEWVVADFAIMGFVGVNVAVNRSWNYHDFKNILNTVDVSLFLYADSCLETVAKVRQLYPEIRFLSFGQDFLKLLQKGRQLLLEKAGPFHFEEVDVSKMCKIVFSSGTTSTPKASMLTQKNMFSGMEGFDRRIKVGEADINYLFLPLSYTYSGVINLLYSLLKGYQVYLATGLKNAAYDMRHIHPTVISVVPLFLEKIYGDIGTGKQRMLKGLIAVSNGLLKCKIDLRKVFFRQIHAAFGGRIRYLICSGAFLDRALKRFFMDIGFTLIEGYALSETASVFTAAYSTDDLYSVGTVIEGIDVRIDRPDQKGQGEIIVKGDNVCLGYYRNESATEAAFDSAGYFHTGDIGSLAQDGQLYLYGRKKRVIITGNGENVYPEELEALFEQVDGVNKAKVYQQDNKIAAGIYCVSEKAVEKAVYAVNETLPKYKKIATFSFVEDSLNTRLK